MSELNFTSVPQYTLTADPVKLTIISTKPDSKPVVFPDYKAWIDTLLKLADKETIEYIEFTQLPPANTIARFQFSKNAIKTPYDWDDYDRANFEEASARRDRAINASLTDQILYILTSQEPYADELRTLFSKGTILSDLQRFHQTFAHLYDEEYFSDLPKDNATVYNDKHTHKNVVGKPSQTSYKTQTLIDLIKEYQTIRWFQDNGIEPFQKPTLKYEIVFFRNRKDALAYAIDKWNHNVPSIVHKEAYDIGAYHYKVVSLRDEFDDEDNHFCFQRFAYGDALD